ncbi:MAG: HAD-IA family hydrolase [Planctomycetota bacterium]|nr:MAG: HAD-IA family hydrolase [Planctomycetota bacterium]
MPLVILDCDGVLVDSERITTGLLATMSTELGWAVTPEQSVEQFKGRDLHEIRDFLEERTGATLGDAFITRYRERMAEQFESRGVPAIAGAAELLDWLDDAAITHAVASNAPHSKMALTLGRIGRPRWANGWFDRFEGRRFSAYEIERWKPDPALFLHAAQRMGHEPANSIVVEDSTSGVRAAVAADMRVIALADLTSPEALAEAGATEVCRSLPEVANLLGRWID